MRRYLCEKPAQGKDIARVLGATKRGEGCYSGAGLAVTWCIGHLLETTPPGGSRAGEALARRVNPQVPRGGLRAAASFARAPAPPRFPAALEATGDIHKFDAPKCGFIAAISSDKHYFDRRGGRVREPGAIRQGG